MHRPRLYPLRRRRSRPLPLHHRQPRQFCRRRRTRGDFSSHFLAPRGRSLRMSFEGLEHSERVEVGSTRRCEPFTRFWMSFGPRLRRTVRQIQRRLISPSSVHFSMPCVVFIHYTVLSVPGVITDPFNLRHDGVIALFYLVILSLYPSCSCLLMTCYEICRLALVDSYQRKSVVPCSRMGWPYNHGLPMVGTYADACQTRILQPVDRMIDQQHHAISTAWTPW